MPHPITALPATLVDLPDFQTLLNDLSGRIHSNGVSEIVDFEYQEARCKLDRARRSYLSNLLLLTHTKNIVREHELTKLTHEKKQPLKSQKTRKALDRLSKRLDRVEAAQSLNCLSIGEKPGASSSSTNHQVDHVFGLDEQKVLDKKDEDDTPTEEGSKKVYHIIESSMERQYAELYNYIAPCLPSSSSSPEDNYGCMSLETKIPMRASSTSASSALSSLPLPTGHTLTPLNLPSRLQEIQALIRLEKKQLQQKQNQHALQFIEYYKLTRECLSSIVDIVRVHKLRHRYLDDKVTKDWLVASISMHYLDMCNLKLRVCLDTYTPETVEALRNLKQTMDLEEKRLMREIQVAEDKLAQYASLGGEYDQLAEELALLQDQIKHREWSVDKI